MKAKYKVGDTVRLVVVPDEESPVWRGIGYVESRHKYLGKTGVIAGAKSRKKPGK